MSQFDTHGGYFAPKDYMKVEAGGSHEENPNGGVQIGVDQEGTPNLLEEGEPVYKDYVYSDNIKASERFLRDNNIPAKYAGQLYSKIADSFFSEAENRPYDPISRNGLEAMLGRLADAQEGQKAYNEERSLERELKKLSPDELAALEQMLAEGEQQMAPEAQAQPEIASVGMPQEQVVQQPMLPEQPMMGCGGHMGKKFAAGGNTDDPPYQPTLLFNPETGSAYTAAVPHAQAVLTEPAVVTADDPKRVAFENQIREGTNSVANNIYNLTDEALKLSPAAPVVYGGHALADAANGDYVQAGKDLAFSLFAGALKSGAELDQWAMGRFGSTPKEIDNALSATRSRITKLQEELQGIIARHNASAYKGDKQILNGLTRDVSSKLKAEQKELARLEKQAAAIKKKSGQVSEITNAVETSGEPVASLTEQAPTVEAATSPSKFKKVAKAVAVTGTVGGLGTGAFFLGKNILDTVASNKEARNEGTSTGSFKSVNKLADGGKVNKFVTGGPYGRYPNNEWQIDPYAYFDDTTAVSLPVRTSRYYEPGAGKYDETAYFDDAPGRELLYPRAFEYEASQKVPYVPQGKYVPYLWNPRYEGWTFDKNDPRIGPILIPQGTGAGTTGEGSNVSTSGDIDVVSGDLVDYSQLPGRKGTKRAAAQAAVTTRPGLGLPEGPGITMPEGYDEHEKNLANSLAWDWLNSEADRLGLNTVPTNYPQASPKPEVSTSTDVSATTQTNPAVSKSNYLSTFPRYAGAIGSGILGLYNAFQRPDEYKGTRYKPFVPSGRISLQDQVYNPVDQNMLMSQVLAQGNSTQRALRNSGLGPSTAAAVIAQDNNLTGNIGNTLLQTWDANNQRRNAVIAANNQNEAQRAQFDANIDYYRQRALAEAQMRNAQQNLTLQQLNYGAEGDKYAAVSNQISNALQALSGIGQENFAMNQVNTNPYNEGYGTFGNGAIVYAPGMWRIPKKKCGGKIQRKKK